MQRPGGPAGDGAGSADRRERQYFPLVDPIRAVAALCVVFLHCAILSGATLTSSTRWGLILDHLNVGVAIFFVISGFVLYRPFVAARARSRTAPTIGRYVWRRFLRIAPAYWLALLALGLAPGLPGVFGHNWWVYFSLLQFYPVYTSSGCGGPDLVCGLGQTWSLAIEVVFYVLLPFLALGLDLAARRLRGGGGYLVEFLVVGWLAAASIVYRAAGFNNGSPGWTFNTVLVYFDWFAAGMLLASVSVRVAGSPLRRGVGAAARHGAVLFWAAAAGVYALLCWHSLPATPALKGQSLAQDMQEHLGFALVAVLLLTPVVLTVEGGLLTRLVLGNPLMMWLGKVSYGIFLWHLTIAAALADTGAATWWPDHRFWSLTLSVLALTVPIAGVSYHLVERPIMDLLSGRRRPSAAGHPAFGSRRAPAPVPVVVAPALAAGLETT